MKIKMSVSLTAFIVFLFLSLATIIVYITYSYSKYQNRTPILKTVDWYSKPKESHDTIIVKAIKKYIEQSIEPEAIFTIYEVGIGKTNPFEKSVFYTIYVWKSLQKTPFGLLRLIKTGTNVRILANKEPYYGFSDLSNWFPTDGGKIVYGWTITNILGYAGYKSDEVGQSIDIPIMVNEKKIEQLVNDYKLVNGIFNNIGYNLLKTFNSDIKLYVKQQNISNIKIKDMEYIYAIKYLDHSYNSYFSYPVKNELNIDISSDWTKHTPLYQASFFVLSPSDLIILPGQQFESFAEDIIHANLQLDRNISKYRKGSQPFYTEEYVRNKLVYTSYNLDKQLKNEVVDMDNIQLIAKGVLGNIYVPTANKQLYERLYKYFIANSNILLKDKLSFDVYRKSFPIILYRNSLGYYEAFYRDYGDISIHKGYHYLVNEDDNTIQKYLSDYLKSISEIKKR